MQTCCSDKSGGSNYIPGLGIGKENIFLINNISSVTKIMNLQKNIIKFVPIQKMHVQVAGVDKFVE